MSNITKQNSFSKRKAKLDITYNTTEDHILNLRCLRCGRLLKNKSSVERGMGPVCSKKSAEEQRN